MYYTEWMDRKLVRILHTVPTFKGSCVRQVKDGVSWQRKAYQRPSIIPVYNKGMGGTDAGDQRAQCYRPHLKTVSWLPRIFSHFLNVAVVNAFILCSTMNSMKLPKTHLEFREQLILSLIEPNRRKRVLQVAGRATRGMSKQNGKKSDPDSPMHITRRKQLLLKTRKSAPKFNLRWKHRNEKLGKKRLLTLRSFSSDPLQKL